MFEEPTSKHVAGVTELTLVAPIKEGYIPPPSQMTYAERLRETFEVLFAIEKRSSEVRGGNVPPGPLESLQTLHDVRFSIFDNDTKLLLGVSFDGPWEPYIRLIAEQGGALLDLLLCHCEDYVGHTTRDGYPAFAKWVRKNQINCDFFYPNRPELTVNDIRYLQQLEQLHQTDPRKCQPRAATMSLKKDESLARPPVRASSPDVALRVLEALFVLTENYPPPRPTDEFPESQDHEFLLETAHKIIRVPKGRDPLSPGNLSDEQEKQYKRQLEWFRGSSDGPRSARKDGASGSQASPSALQVALSDKEKSEVQPNIIKGIEPSPTHGCLLLMQLDRPDLVRTELAGVVNDGDGRPTVNVALTYPGLTRLVESPALLAKLPKEFREGMEARAGVLGDLGPNHPSRWEGPRALVPGDVVRTTGERVALSSVDVVVIIQKTVTQEGSSASAAWSPNHPLYKDVVELVERLGPGARLLAVQPLERKINEEGRAVEHFGYVDGLSQPWVNGGVERLARDQVPLGEILCGHENMHGDRVEEHTSELLRNGSFLVVRKLEQNVPAFRKFIGKDHTLQAKIMGRYPNGIPLSKQSGNDQRNHNDFEFEGDREGRQCPLHAHIRRAHPRDAEPDEKIPRIMRRGFSYGPRLAEGAENDGRERGLVFMAYNASIADQFELIQRWIAGGNSTGILSSYDDVLLGVHRPRKVRWFDGSGELQDKALDEPLVTLRWGLYLFAPSKKVLERLAKGDAFKSDEAAALRARRGPDQHEAKARKRIEDMTMAEVKHLIEDRSTLDERAEEWERIRTMNDGVVRHDEYGVLVGSHELAREVLLDPGERFSTRGYWERLEPSIGELYLGVDEAPTASEPGPRVDRALENKYLKSVEPGRYRELSSAPNGFLSKIGRLDAFMEARQFTLAGLELLPEVPGAGRVHFNVKNVPAILLSVLIGFRVGIPDGLPQGLFEPGGAAKPPNLDPAVLNELARRLALAPEDVYVGIGGDPPAGSNRATCPMDFISVARSPFFPHPPRADIELANERGQAIQKAALAFVRSSQPQPGTLFEHLRRTSPTTPDDVLSRQLSGSVQGAVVATSQSLFLVLYQWMKSGRIWRLRTSLGIPNPERAERRRPDWEKLVDDQSPFMEAIVGAMTKFPVPDLLFRIAVKETTLGGVTVYPGDRVIISLGSVARDKPGEYWLFGGAYNGKPNDRHACPAAEWALGTIAGCTCAILEQKDLREENALVLSYEK